MKQRILLLILLATSLITFAQISCPPGQKPVEIIITPDSYPLEISWNLRTPDSTIIASGGSAGESLCVAENLCLIFTIYDTYGDGILFPGGYSVSYAGTVIRNRVGYNFGYREHTEMGCPVGFSCQSAAVISEGIHTAPNREYWYSFTPDSTGFYRVTTCGLSSCNTSVWIYEACDGINVTNGIEGALCYNNNACGNQSTCLVELAANQTYFIRIGGLSSSCTGTIPWRVNFDGYITGCQDPAACNYHPLATAPGVCYYPGNPNCASGPDLVIVESAIWNSIYLSTVNNSDQCQVVEGCLTGMGTRYVIRFSTHLKNIGDQDYYIGNPSSNPDMFDLNNCHGHAHFTNYAEYLLYDWSGNLMPAGFKMGFCVMDIECSGGGTFTYNCGTMGISAGCGDIYGSGTTCNWVDVTDVPAGTYTLVLRTNYERRPDALGRHETDYDNNWGQACFVLTRNAQNVPSMTLLTPGTCMTYYDCAGVAYGLSVPDCAGNCNGSALFGDIDANNRQDTIDVDVYLSGIVNGTLTATPCIDLHRDSVITVYDPALLQKCYLHTWDQNACNFPRGYLNINETVTLSIAYADFQAGYIDIAITNPASSVLAYQFVMHGLTITDVQSLVNPADFSAEPVFSATTGRIAAIAKDENYLNRNNSPALLCRVFFSQMTGSAICIAAVEEVVNHLYEKTQKQVGGGCVQPTSFPFNDNCSNAYPLYCGMTVFASTDSATATGSPAPCISAGTGPGVWYRFAGNNNLITATTCGAGTNFNTVIQVYSGNCGSLVCLASNNDSCGVQSIVSWYAHLNNDYFIHVGGANGVTGNFELAVSCIDPCPTPSGLVAIDTTSSGIQINWVSANPGATYTVEVVGSGSLPGTGNNLLPLINGITGVNGPPVTISGMVLGQTYHVYVREACPNGFQSFNAGPLVFTAVTLPPPNDLCQNAIHLNCGAYVSGSTNTATSIGLPPFCQTSASSAGVWYTVTGNGGTITVSTCTTGTNYDTKLHVYTGNCGAFVCVTGNDDFQNCGLQSQVSWTSTLGTTYYIYVSGYNQLIGNFGLSVSCTSINVPSNDLCQNAASLTCGNTLTGTTVGATSTGQPFICVVPVGGPGVWYQILGTGDTLVVSTCQAATFDTRLTVYLGICGSLACVSGNDDFCGIRSSVEWPSQIGVTYYVYVSGVNNASGTFSIDLACRPVVTPPPANDFCQNAIVVACSNTYAGTTIDATTDNAIAGNNCGTPITQPGVWYRFVGNDSRVTFSTCGLANFDTKISVFSGSNCGNLVCLAGNDDFIGCSGNTSRVSVNAHAGTDYYVLVHGYSGTGNFDLSVTCTPLCTSPANDLCNGAIPIIVSNAHAGACVPVIGTNACASYSLSNPSCDPFSAVQDVWFTFNTGLADSVAITLQAITATNLKLAVYSGSCNGPMVLCITSAATGTHHLAGLNPNTNYYIQVYNQGFTAEGTFSVCVQNFLSPYNCGMVTGQSVSRITPVSARLEWTPVTGAVGYQIRGKAISSSTWMTINVTPGTASHVDVSGIYNQVTYEWQIRSFCNIALTDSSDWSASSFFTTGCYPPASVWAGPVTTSAARLNWTRVYGVPGYEIRGQKLGAPNWINLLVGGSATVHKDVYGLESNTQYRYRVRTWCTSNGSMVSAWSEMDTFQTLPPRFLSDELLESQSDEYIIVYPNPFSQNAVVEFFNPDGDTYTLNLKDIAGRTLYSISDITENNVVIERKGLSPGIYLIELSGKNTYRTRVVMD